MDLTKEMEKLKEKKQGDMKIMVEEIGRIEQHREVDKDKRSDRE